MAPAQVRLIFSNRLMSLTDVERPSSGISWQQSASDVSSTGLADVAACCGAPESTEPSGTTTMFRPPRFLTASETCAFALTIDRPLCGS
jgi:hypothetical protein